MYSGYLSLGHAAFFGIGAYAIGVRFTHAGIGAGYTPFLVLPLVGVAVAMVSAPIAWVALRVRAATFAIVTITLLFVVQQLAFNLHGITNGSQGLALPAPRFSTAAYERPFYLAMVAVLAIAVLTCWWVRGSKLGLMLFAIRDDEDRARGLGIQTTTAKVAAFVASVGLTAMAGGAWAYYIGFIYPQFAVDPLITIGAVLIAAVPQPVWAFLRMRSMAADVARADEVLDEFGLLRLAEAPAGELSFGQRKLLEFATVLMSRPKLVLLDEPTSGVNPNMVLTIERHIRALNAEGLTFLVVEHDMNLSCGCATP